MKNFKNKQYDFVYLTNTPSFYKVNLCNEIGKKRKLLLVLYGYGSEAVNSLIENKRDLNFDFIFLYRGNSLDKNKLVTFLKLARLLVAIKYKKLIFSGWFVPEYNLISIFTPKSKNCVICESSIKESSFTGVKCWLKRKIISRMSVALPSGQLHKEIFTEVNFKGEINVTGGVGLINKSSHKINKTDTTKFKYLYVGRLIEVKNLAFLIKEFNENGKPLTIVGQGNLETELHNLARPNITFTGFVENEKLPELYQTHDVVILPSISEPWGLVIDEALYYGLPVIVSDRVGCSIDLVQTPETGCVFTLNDSNSFKEAIFEIENNYKIYKENVLKIDFDKRNEMQITTYLQLI